MNTLKDQISSGTYTINSYAIAEKLLTSGHLSGNSVIDTANERLQAMYPEKHVPIGILDIEAVYTRNILSVDADAKTSKGVRLGYLTGILYLSPSNHFTKVNLCPHASEACRSACLFTAGRGRFYSVTRARVIKTLALLLDSSRFIQTVKRSIVSLEKKAKNRGLIPAVRLNGTSDLDWSRYNLKDSTEHIDIFEYFRNIQFYDYTKRPRAILSNRHKNYHITFSDSGTNERHIADQPFGTNIATVFLTNQLPDVYQGKIVINGDNHDLRFLDETNVIVGLRAKGSAKRTFNSFVKDNRE